jgi:hypothetical protein
MSKRQGLASKLLAVLGGAGLAIGICAARASAQASKPPPWSNANFDNRYICNADSHTFNPITNVSKYYTGVMKINPNGTGGYTAGTLNASLSPFFLFQPSSTPPTNFCSYSLNTAASGYAVAQNGQGLDMLTWTASTANNALCPASFVENDRFVLRNNVTGNNVVPRTDFTSNNFLGLHSAVAALIVEDPGSGYCLK